MTRLAKAVMGANGASPSVKFAAMALARGLAQDGAGDENEIAERLLSSL